jgi:glycosyltransferase involved in cell wall biosynthesis
MIMNQNKSVVFLLKRVDCNDGVASHCETLIRGLRDRGWQVFLVTGDVGYDQFSIKRFELLKELSEDWIVLENMQSFIPKLSNILRVKEIIKKHKISLVHVHGYSMMFFAAIVKLLTGLKSVATFHPSVHGGDPTTLRSSVLNPKNRKYQIYLRLFTPKFFIALSSDIEHFLIKDLGFGAVRVRKVLAGIDTNYFHPPTLEQKQRSRQKYGFADQDLVCTLVGRLNWNKGHDVLIDAVRRTKKIAPEISLKCLLVGGGNQEKDIKEYAFKSAEDADCFIFSGFAEDLREIYWATDIFVLPSRLEGFGLSVAEAMCCETVPIRTPSGGAIDQIEQGKTGYIIPFDDHHQLSDFIQKLADRDLRLQIAKQSAEYALSVFDQRVMVEKIIDIYWQCCR